MRLSSSFLEIFTLADVALGMSKYFKYDEDEDEEGIGWNRLEKARTGIKNTLDIQYYCTHTQKL